MFVKLNVEKQNEFFDNINRAQELLDELRKVFTWNMSLNLEFVDGEEKAPKNSGANDD